MAQSRPGPTAPRYLYAYQQAEMDARAYFGQCPSCARTTTSRSAWFTPLQLIVEHQCPCGVKHLDARPVGWFGVQRPAFTAVGDTIIPLADELGYFGRLLRDWFRRDIPRLRHARPLDAGGGLVVLLGLQNIWHAVVDHLYMAFHHHLTEAPSVTTYVFKRVQTLASLILDDVRPLPCEDLLRVTNGFAYMAHPVAPEAGEDRKPRKAGYPRPVRMHRREFLDHLSERVAGQPHDLRPALFLTVRFENRMWLPLLQKTTEVVERWTSAHPEGGVILHGMPMADGAVPDDAWHALAARPDVVTVFDQDALTQAGWCAAADVCLQGSGAALVWPAITSKPTVIMGYRHNILTDEAGLPEDRSTFLQAGEFVDHPYKPSVCRSYRRPSATEALEAVHHLMQT